MANWPEALEVVAHGSHIVSLPVAALAQLRRDRDELVGVLQEICDNDWTPDTSVEGEGSGVLIGKWTPEAVAAIKALLARVKGR